MTTEREDPAALAGAHRVEVTKLTGKNDFDNPTGAALDRQVRSLLKRYAISLPLAIAICEHAFGGRSQR